MTLSHTTLSRLMLAVFAAGACMAASTAAAQAISPEAQYKTDVARCQSGDTNQDKATCMREAGAALEEAKRNRLMHDNANYDQNQVRRCQALPADQREDCMLQMSPGSNTQVQGSVAGGGVLRETTITIPGQPATSTAAPTAPNTPPVIAPSAPVPATSQQTMPAPQTTTPPSVPAPGSPVPPPPPAVPPGTGVQ